MIGGKFGNYLVSISVLEGEPDVSGKRLVWPELDADRLPIGAGFWKSSDNLKIHINYYH